MMAMMLLPAMNRALKKSQNYNKRPSRELGKKSVKIAFLDVVVVQG